MAKAKEGVSGAQSAAIAYQQRKKHMAAGMWRKINCGIV